MNPNTTIIQAKITRIILNFNKQKVEILMMILWCH